MYKSANVYDDKDESMQVKGKDEMRGCTVNQIVGVGIWCYELVRHLEDQAQVHWHVGESRVKFTAFADH